MRVLEERWKDLWMVCGAPRIRVGALYSSMRARYCEPHRKYHDFDHIAFCLHEFDAVRHLAEDLHTVEIALWMHDVIYDPKAKDNEDNSIEFAHKYLPDLGVTNLEFDKIAKRIEATKHTTLLTENDDMLIADVDLAGFGQSWEVVAASSRKIRFEYSWVPREEYLAGRTKVLQYFLDRPQGIYHLPHMRGKYDTQARANIAREIKELAELTPQ